MITFNKIMGCIVGLEIGGGLIYNCYLAFKGQNTFTSFLDFIVKSCMLIVLYISIVCYDKKEKEDESAS